MSAYWDISRKRSSSSLSLKSSIQHIPHPKSLDLSPVHGTVSQGFPPPTLPHTHQHYLTARLNHKLGKLEPSFAEFQTPLHPLFETLLRLLSRLRLLRLYTISNPPPTSVPGTTSVTKQSSDITTTRGPDDIIACSNLTLINLVLVNFGPMREDHLCLTLLAGQVLCGVLGLVIRHKLAFLVYDRDS